MISKCSVCSKHKVQHPEPLLPSALPEHPWQKVATDLFEWNSSTYLLVVDYYSRYVELAKLTSTTSTAVIKHLKSIFARHGLPQIVVSDNGPQYSSSVFTDLAKQYDFTHITSSPQFPQANGAAERAVRTVKTLLTKSDDPHMAMLAYRSTPLEDGYSPAQLLMGRQLCTLVPTMTQLMKPKLPSCRHLRQKEAQIKQRQKRNFDSRHKATDLKHLKKGDAVWLPDRNEQGTIVKPQGTRSYIVESESQGTYRRNRKIILPMPSQNKSKANTPKTNNTKDENSKKKMVTVTFQPASESAELEQVEAIVNSRPLSYLSSEDIEEPLTPSH